MARDGDDAKGPAQGKRPYEPPRIESEAVFETTALACGKIGGQGGKCTGKPKNS
jgi:hypothetical protein